MQQTTAAEVRLDAGRAARFSASVRSTGGFDRLPRTRCAICRCSRRPKGRSWSRNDPESGECRFENLAETLATFVTLASIQLALRRLVRVQALQ
jgi:hypothetical protein